MSDLQDKDYEDWEYSPEGLHYQFSGNYWFIDQEQEVIFFNALSKLSKKVIDFAQKIYFTSINSNNYAETFRLKGNFVKGRIAIVILYPAIWTLSFEKITAYIAHEIAHVYLKHEWGQTHDISKEKEADDLASEWLGYKVDFYTKFEKRLKRLEHARYKR